MSGARLVLERAVLTELAPVLRRAVSLEPACLARIRLAPSTASVLVRLPFGVLAARTIAAEHAAESVDATVGALALLDWLDAEPDHNPDADRTTDRAGGSAAGRAAHASLGPETRDADWRGGLPPDTGWQRVDTVPDDVVRGLVRTGALALKESAAREGGPGAQPRAEVAAALLDSVVLTVTDDDCALRAEVTLRALSALTRMGFLPRTSHLAVDLAGRWIRVAAAYGSIFIERPGLGLGLVAR